MVVDAVGGRWGSGCAPRKTALGKKLLNIMENIVDGGYKISRIMHIVVYIIMWKGN